MIRQARSRGIPLYYQVMRSLKEDIVAGRFAPEERLPSELELTEMFKVSRVVVRQALQILEDEGLIDRLKGKGTFVNKDATAEEVPVLSGYIEDFLRVGLSTKAKVLQFGIVKATPDLATVFHADEGTELFYVKRLRTVEGRPFSVIENYLPYDVGMRIPLVRIEDEPLMSLIEEYTGIPIDWATQVFQAISADAELAGLLEIDPMAPILKMNLTAYTVKGQVVNNASVFYRSDRYNHHGYLRRRRGEDAFGWTPVERIVPETH